MKDDTPLPRGLSLFAGIGERAYRAELDRRNRRFDAGRGVVTIDRPVISVGNLSVGGTGKTPMVERIARWLVEAGHQPAIAMRGYRSVGGFSDEARVYEQTLTEVPVVAQPDRLTGLFRLFAERPEIDVVLLDDGFQHRRIARQLDLVLVDATRDPFADRCLPAGWLREPVENLARASAAVLTHAEMVDDAVIRRLRERIERFGVEVIAAARHEWEGLIVHEDGRDRHEPVSWLVGRRPAAVCAIARPEGFLHALERATGRAPDDALILRDHDPYGRRTIDRVLASAAERGCLATTPKDWAKLERIRHWPCPVARPVLRMGFAFGESTVLERVLETAAMDPDLQ